MPKIIVLGAGIGGISAAYELRETLGTTAEILVVSDFGILPFRSFESMGGAQMASR